VIGPSRIGKPIIRSFPWRPRYFAISPSSAATSKPSSGGFFSPRTETSPRRGRGSTLRQAALPRRRRLGHGAAESAPTVEPPSPIDPRGGPAPGVLFFFVFFWPTVPCYGGMDAEELVSGLNVFESMLKIGAAGRWWSPTKLIVRC